MFVFVFIRTGCDEEDPSLSGNRACLVNARVGVRSYYFIVNYLPRDEYLAEKMAKINGGVKFNTGG